MLPPLMVTLAAKLKANRQLQTARLMPAMNLNIFYTLMIQTLSLNHQGIHHIAIYIYIYSLPVLLLSHCTSG